MKYLYLIFKFLSRQKQKKIINYGGNLSQPYQIADYIPPYLDPNHPPHLLFIAPSSKATEAQEFSKQLSFLIFRIFPKNKQTETLNYR